MANPNRLDRTIVRTGLTTQALDYVPVIGGFFRWTRGSSSPYYSQIEWQEVEEVVDEDGNSTELPTAEADPTTPFLADLIQRRKKEVAFVGVGQLALRRVLLSSGGQVAVASAIRNVPIAARLHDLDDLGYLREEDMYTAGLRAGSQDYPVGIVSWLERESKVVVPPGLTIVRQHLDINKPEDFPDVDSNIF